MRYGELGIDVKTGYHRKLPLTGSESRFLGALWVHHVGEANALPAKAFSERTAMSMRDVRVMQNHLLFDHNIPVLSQAGYSGGYFMAENEGEAKAFYATFRRRGLTGLVKASRGKQSAMVEMVTQLSFEFDELVDQVERTPRIRPAVGAPMPVEIVDAFLTRMTQNPEKFADDIRKLREKHGAILLPKERVRAMQAQAEKLRVMVASLGN